MFSTIDRYIVKIYLGYLIASLVVFVTLFLSVDFMTNVAKFSASLDVLLKYYTLLAPSIIFQMLPIAFIMSTIFCLSGLNKSNELVALFSSGLSLARISLPIVIVVSIFSVCSFFASDIILPKLDQEKNQIFYYEIKKKPWLISTVRQNKIWFRSKNRLFNLQYLRASDAKAQGLTLYYFDEMWNLLQVVTAKNVNIRKNYWLLMTGRVTLFNETPGFPQIEYFGEKTIDTGEEFASLDANFNSADMMTSSQLREFIDRNKEAGLNTLEYEVGLHKKISYAFSGLILCLLGIPFSVGDRRSGGRGRSIGICVLIVFSYWLSYSSALNFGKHGVVPAWLAAWTPNVLFFLLAIALLLRTKK
ncbi:MAG: LPS export ABC transporter permease LptG [Bdellovibrionales bacterium]|nr:LPS export ABC transporter permease LptG [Bdellovibrionales bacterium]